MFEVNQVLKGILWRYTITGISVPKYKDDLFISLVHRL